MGKPRDLANLISTGNPLSDGAIAVSEISDLTATAAELNIMDGVTASTAELNYVDGVTSNVQTQMDTKAPTADPTFTGTTTIPTADINGGAIDGAVIGANSAAALTATTINASTKLQVNGTDVITNARQLSNIASIDATTAAAITTAGVGGANTFDATASGALANGDPVILNANGTVSKPALSISPNDPATFGYANGADVNGASITQSMSAAYNSNTGTTGAGAFITVFEDTTAGNVLSANLMTIRTDGEFNVEGKISLSAGLNGNRGTDVCFNEPLNKFVVAYRHDSNNITLKALTPTGARTVSAGSGYTVSTNGNAPRIATDNKNTYNFLVSFTDHNNEIIYVRPAQYNTSNNSFTFGTKTRIGTTEGTTSSSGHTLVYDSANDKFIIIYFDNANSIYLNARVITFDSSNNSLSIGNTVELTTVKTNAYNFGAVYTTGGKTVIAVRNTADSDYLTTVIFTTSGTSGSFSTAQRVFTRAAENVSVGYDDNTNRVGISFSDGTNSDYASFVTGSVGTSSITFQSSNPVTLNSTGRSQTTYPTTRLPFSGTNVGTTLDTARTADNKMLVFYNESSRAKVQPANLGTTSTSLTSSNYLGIADAAYSDGATATIQTMGAIDDAQSGMTIGAKQYVQSDGTIAGTADTPSVEAGLALSATKLLVKG